MKKIKIIIVFSFIGFFLLNACRKDEQDDTNIIIINNNPQGPTLTISADVTSAWQGDTITFTYSVSSNKVLELLSWTTSAPSIAPAGEVALTGNSATNKTIDIVLPTAGITEGTLKFTFVATDKDGEEYADTKEVTITLEPLPANTPFATEVTTGMFYHIQGSLQGAYDLDGDALVSSSGTASTKSMKNTDGAGVTFTGSWTSDAANGTMYVKTTTIYADIYQENAATIYTAGSASATVTNPAAGDVYVAKKGSTYYVISITAVSPTDNTCSCGNTGKITFKYKK